MGRMKGNEICKSPRWWNMQSDFEAPVRSAYATLYMTSPQRRRSAKPVRSLARDSH